MHSTFQRVYTLTASQIIVTSYLFPNAKFSLERLMAMSNAVGRDRLVVDVRYVALYILQHIGEYIFYC